jgi:hypothetical protein
MKKRLSSILLQVQSILIFILLIYTSLQFKSPNDYLSLINYVIIWDLLLVIQIEVKKYFINKEIKTLNKPFILKFHLALAVITVILYLVNLYMTYSINNYFELIVVLTIVFRFGTLITSGVFNFFQRDQFSN